MHVEAAEVRQMGGAVLDTAGRLDRLAAAVESFRAAAATAVEGSLTCHPVAEEVAVGCRRTLAGLAGEVRAFGTELLATADAYRGADGRAADRLREAGY